ncbi:unnamed protein product [Adineta steineri]|uniref:RING-type domain-containing protein n=2 Tax=Adineta steineri TaxID=433720 RepID=A0A815V4G6_9BILA|nr:unnamed protein product [Adineta steineri]
MILTFSLVEDKDIMRQWFQKSRSGEVGRRPAILRELFARIRAVRLRDEYNKRSGYLTPPVYLLLGCVLFPLILLCRIHVYNMRNGPFHMNLYQFTVHLISCNQGRTGGNSLPTHWWSVEREYFQIELGQDQIEQVSAHTLRGYPYYFQYFKPSYTMKAVQNDGIYQALYPNRVFIKLPVRGQNHFHSRLPYRFHEFTIETLRCIVRQLGVLPTSYIKWHDKGTYHEEELRQEQEAIQARAATERHRLAELINEERHRLAELINEHRHRLAELINEERQQQIVGYLRTLTEGSTYAVPASPQFIGAFRLRSPETVENYDNNLLETKCAVCQCNFESGQEYSQWPCDGRHTFHYACMLNLLRNSYTCPICRHAVEAANVFDIEVAARYSMTQLVYRPYF